MSVMGQAEISIVGVGHSHGWALKRASQSLNRDGVLDAAFPLVGSKAFPAKLCVDTHGGRTVCAEIGHILSSTLGKAFFASALFGNHHNIVGLLARSQPWTVTWKRPVAKSEEFRSTRALSEDAFREYLMSRLSPLKELLSLVRCRPNILGVVHFSSPPPTASDENFNDTVPGDEIASPWLRLALWECQRTVMQEICAEVGAFFVDIPNEVLDPAGYLLPEFSRDGVHGTSAFGERQLLKAVELVGGAE